MPASLAIDKAYARTAGGSGMDVTEKTFRYSHIFRNIGVPYFMFLFLVSILSYFARDMVILTVLGMTIAFGLFLLVLYRTSGIQVSDRGITQKTLLGSKSLDWEDIRQIYARGSSLRVQGDHVTLSISPRLYGAMEISQWINTKRPDLFKIRQIAWLERNNNRNITIMSIGLLLVVLSGLLYFYRDYLFVPGVVGPLLCALAAGNWYFSPRGMVLDGNRLIVRFQKRSVSYAAHDIAGIQASKTQQDQFRSVVVGFRDRHALDLSVFQQTPFITYPVLKKWHQKSVTR
jgi:hypothetical protein